MTGITRDEMLQIKRDMLDAEVSGFHRRGERVIEVRLDLLKRLLKALEGGAA